MGHQEERFLEIRAKLLSFKGSMQNPQVIGQIPEILISMLVDINGLRTHVNNLENLVQELRNARATDWNSRRFPTPRDTRHNNDNTRNNLRISSHGTTIMTLIALILVLIAEEQGVTVFVASGGDIAITWVFAILLILTFVGDVKRAIS